MGATTPTQFYWLLAVPLLPLAAWVLQVCFGRFLPRQGDWLPTGAMGVSAFIAVSHFLTVLSHHDPNFLLEGLPTWKFFFSDPNLTLGLAGFEAGMLYDNLSAALLAMVALVSFLVHLFSIGYMKGDSRYNIFFSNLSLFTFAMLALVLSDNLVFFFIFWEIMGLCSYLLIGHLALDKKAPRMEAAWASLKAFMTTRIGDICLFIGMMMMWKAFGTLSFHELYAAIDSHVAVHGWESWLTVAGIMMFLGAVGKSAQFPLHVWLPDAMEGPTPVSAMIHAATMVAAGVYLTGRIFLMMSPEAQLIVACLGGFTAIFAATIGITQFDIKKVLAYSTISQLGYMICAIGAGGVAAGLFHMLTHAFFKACLFLGSGSVIHGCHHEQDMRKMGGLRSKMPITWLTMLVSTLAISGVPFFAGFYSKDAIIAKTLERSMVEGSLIWSLPFYMLIVAAGITAFYMFRLMFMTFHGKPRGHGAEEAHESPWTMTVPLVVLGLLAVVGGKFWILDPVHGVSGGEHPWFLHLVENPVAFGAAAIHVTETQAHHAHHSAMVISLSVAGFGIFLACLFYLWRVLNPAKVATALGGVYRLVLDKYRFDELYQATVIRGTTIFSAFLAWFDRTFVDGVVNGMGATMKGLSNLSAAHDRVVVDGFVELVAEVTSSAGQLMRRFQTGRIQQYAYFTFAGAVLIAAVLLLEVL
ncbi:MAG: NADH-quinone oxidoreductase subunit L [Planctomycetota bacterium]|jgi:NADH-quinone oxidoreductase subunit L|nr:NADH-quinone oxidoreductase subunit L [Planctomycetota bacterium]MDP6942021.1 NADH-quinone oxidoreductase subunit L [Planctomycetota bacterium]